MPYENVDYISICIALAVAAVLAALAIWKKLLTLPATAVAVVVLIVAATFTGYVGIVVYALSFALIGAVSLIGKQTREKRESGLHKRHGRRGVVQVICNGVPSLIFAAVYFATGKNSLMVAFVATLAAGFADSAASDIGILSRMRARNIITMKEVPSGISGGVTLLGTASAFVAAIIVPAVAIPFAGYGWQGFLIAAAAAFIGTIIDSVLGATVQVKYVCGVCGSLTERTEHCGTPTRRVSGVKFIDNDVVNVLSILIVGVIVAVLPI